MLFAAGGAFLKGYYRRPLIDLESATGSVMILPCVCLALQQLHPHPYPTLSTYKPNAHRPDLVSAPTLLLEDLMLGG